MKDRSNLTLTALGATTVVAVTIVAAWTYRRSSKSSGSRFRDVDKKRYYIDLLPIEQTLASGGGGDNAMSTLTWFSVNEGNHINNSIEYLRVRTRKVLDKNPWLAGRVAKHKGAYTLIVDDDIHNDNKSIDEYFYVTTNVIARDTPFTEVESRLTKYKLKVGPTEPMFRLHIFPCNKSPSHFAVVVSMFHVVGDGFTFFRIQNMLLNAEEPIQSMTLNRIKSTEEQQIKAMGGKEEYNVFSSAGFIAGCIAGVFQAVIQKRKYGPRSLIYLVDQTAMEATKERAIQESNSSHQTQYVSTNDVLTSWFFQNSGCDHGLMAVNFRGRLVGHTNDHAGNYENAIFFRRQDSKSPCLIRQSIANDGMFQRQVTTQQRMPGFFAMFNATIAICTNWSSFAKPCQIQGCIEEVQIPLLSFLPANLAVCLIFRAGPQGLAVMVAGSPDKLKGLQKHVSFLTQ